MLRSLTLFLFIGFISCQKDEELSKARVMWGEWHANEIKIIYDDLKGKRISTTETPFEISFSHTNKGHISGLYNEDFIWAVQDDPDVLIISPELFSVDTLGVLHFNTTDIFYIRDFSSEEITLHNEFTKNDSIISTTERNWVLTPL
jgi:hypothetical protein